MIKLLSSLFTAITNLLPDSPFQTLFDGGAELDFLPYLNWFVPFDNFLKVTRVWVSAILAYYIYDTVSTVINKLIIDKLG